MAEYTTILSGLDDISENLEVVDRLLRYDVIENIREIKSGMNKAMDLFRSNTADMVRIIAKHIGSELQRITDFLAMIYEKVSGQEDSLMGMLDSYLINIQAAVEQAQQTVKESQHIITESISNNFDIVNEKIDSYQEVTNQNFIDQTNNINNGFTLTTNRIKNSQNAIVESITDYYNKTVADISKSQDMIIQNASLQTQKVIQNADNNVTYLKNYIAGQLDTIDDAILAFSERICETLLWIHEDFKKYLSSILLLDEQKILERWKSEYKLMKDINTIIDKQEPLVLEVLGEA